LDPDSRRKFRIRIRPNDADLTRSATLPVNLVYFRLLHLQAAFKVPFLWIRKIADPTSAALNLTRIIVQPGERQEKASFRGHGEQHRKDLQIRGGTGPELESLKEIRRNVLLLYQWKPLIFETFRSTSFSGAPRIVSTASRALPPVPSDASGSTPFQLLALYGRGQTCESRPDAELLTGSVSRVFFKQQDPAVFSGRRLS
jgi:hypothetical protein